ncbi:Ig-like domain-containing protein [Staphylococcus simulans]
MADVLNVYKDDELIKSSEYADGKAKVNIDGLDANTDYASGTYQVARKNENGESDKVDVPAFKTKPIAVTGVTLDKTTLSLQEGATGNLVATVAPSTATDKTVTFASSDAAIATVDNTGKVTAVKPGAADITVTTKDGSKTAKCALTVTAKTIAVTGVTIAPKTASVEVGKTTKVTGTIAPANATDKGMTYKSSAVAIATVSDDGTVTGVAAGEATITVTTKDGSKTDTSIITVTEPVTEPENVEVDPNENDADVSAE